jgi:hypothetical protein
MAKCRKCHDTGWGYAPFYKSSRPCLDPECVAYRATCAAEAAADAAVFEARRQARKARIAARRAQTTANEESK